jgi:hypothetical protein
LTKKAPYKVDRQLELDRKLYGKLARLRAIQNFIHIRRRAPKIIALVIPVGQQAAEFSEKTARIDGQGDGSEPPAT